MIVVCTSCSKRFKLEDGLVPPEGRLVRCTVCSYTWKQWPEKQGPSKSFIDLTASTEFSSSYVLPKRRFRWGILFLFITLSFILLNILAFKRNMIVELWPEAESAYTFVGLPVETPGPGLAILTITPVLISKGGVEMCIIEGEIKNMSSYPRDLSALKIRIVDHTRKRILDHWEQPLTQEFLAPGERLRFETAPRPKVKGGKIVTVGF